MTTTTSAETSTQQAIDKASSQALNHLASTVENLRQDVAPLFNRAADKASAMAHRGVDAVLEGSHQLRDKARHTGDLTVGYIKDEPVKAVLIAAATGAVLMALVGLISRTRAQG